MTILKYRTSSTSDWQSILAIKGDKGDTGATGATGATGRTGPQGPPGEFFEGTSAPTDTNVWIDTANNVLKFKVGDTWYTLVPE